MKYADYYRQFQADAQMMGDDEVLTPDELDDPSSIWRGLTDQQLIDMAAGGAGIKGVGDEIARRGLLDQVPGDNWGE